MTMIAPSRFLAAVQTHKLSLNFRFGFDPFSQTVGPGIEGEGIAKAVYGGLARRLSAKYSALTLTAVRLERMESVTACPNDISQANKSRKNGKHLSILDRICVEGSGMTNFLNFICRFIRLDIGVLPICYAQVRTRCHLRIF